MSETDGTRSARELLRILFQHSGKIITVFILLTGTTFVFCQFWAVPTYRSQVGLIFKRPANDNPLASDSPEHALEVFVKAQQQIVMSDLVLARAKVISEDSGFRRTWHSFRSNLTGAESQGGDVRSAQAAIDGFLTEGPVADRVKALLSENQKDLAEFRESVELETPGGERVAVTESFTIAVDRPGPKTRIDSHLDALYAAEMLVDMYIVRHRQLQQALRGPGTRVMNNVVASFQTDVDAHRKAYDDFVRQNTSDIGLLEQLVKSGSEHGVQIALTRLRESDARLHLDLARARAIREVITADLPPKALEAGGVDAMSGDEVAAAVANISAELLDENVFILRTKEKVADLEAELAGVRTQYTDESRNVRYLERDVRSLRNQLLGAIVAHAQGLGVTIRALEEQRARNSELKDRYAKEQTQITQKLGHYVRLKNDMKVAEEQLADLKGQRLRAEASSLRASEAVTIHKLGEASIPDPSRPKSPKTLLFTLIAGIISLLIGVAAAFIADHFDHSLRSSDEAERYLGLPVLGSIKRHSGGIVAS